jgi:vacuolar-type H+-ATPase subunit E/Vma4
MAEDIKSLIEKINAEGLQVAQDKAASVEADARKLAQEIIAKAQKDAQGTFRQAQENIVKAEATQKALLAQAARDMLLGLRKEINEILTRIIAQEVRQALPAQKLCEIIVGMIAGQQAAAQGAQVTLKKEDLEALQSSILSKLKDEVKKQVTLNPSEDIRGGFMISFDAGKSQFDFSDTALAEYIGTYLKPRLNELLKSAIK